MSPEGSKISKPNTRYGKWSKSSKILHKAAKRGGWGAAILRSRRYMMLRKFEAGKEGAMAT